MEDLLHKRGVDVSYESVRYWWHRFGSKFASEIKKRRAGGMQSSNWKRHLCYIFNALARLSNSPLFFVKYFVVRLFGPSEVGSGAAYDLKTAVRVDQAYDFLMHFFRRNLCLND